MLGPTIVSVSTATGFVGRMTETVCAIPKFIYTAQKKLWKWVLKLKGVFDRRRSENVGYSRRYYK